ncbi:MULTISPECIES: ABC transporter permease [Nitratireductor]|uniref:ABC transporter permease n=1 Tax=Nitratireductor TaxID=245876 RepID=UPI000D0DEB5F|nr:MULTISPECIES: ABC transporter permease [Nitratireductor]PSM17328.1 ABC transporter permease [Nitratireductor sp. StC3]
MASSRKTSREPILAADGTPLKQALRRSQKAERRRAFALVAPLLIFLLIVFVVPILAMIWRSVYNPEIRGYLPQTAAALQQWDGQDVPPEPVFQAMAADMIVGIENRTIGRAAARINREIPGARSTVMRTARQVDEWSAPYREKFLDADADWANPELWRILKRESRLLTPTYYLLAVDYEYNSQGEIAPRPEVYQVYKGLFFRTAWMSILITLICVVLAYPISYMLATQPARIANLLLILVLLPFWTSLLVRTSAWIVLLQQQGVINELLVAVGIIGDDGRLRMIYNRTGTIVAMTHILLPFMVLPLYSVMKTIPPSYLRAAKSLGAHPFRAWWRVYFPLTIPGLAAGCILVFILAIGYYITPALVGGDSGIFISNLIAQNMQGSSAQLKLAAALATILLVAVLIVYWVFNKLVGVDRLKFG